MATFGFTPATEQEHFSIKRIKRSRSSLTSSVLSGEDARHFYENLVKEDLLNRNGLNIRVNQKDDGRNDKSKHRKEEYRIRSRRRVRVQPDAPVRGGPGDREVNPSRGTGHTERSRELMGLRFLHCAHEGNVSGLKDLLSKGVDINFQVQSLPLYLETIFFAYSAPNITNRNCGLQDTFFWTAMMCASWCGHTGAVRLLLERGAAWVGVVDMQGRDAKDLAAEGNARRLLILSCLTHL